MTLDEFHIGSPFWCSGRQWRCTDIGSRVVVAIRIDQTIITTIQRGVNSRRAIGQEEAERTGWFNGPPYAVAEIVFDEDDLEACTTKAND
jgi:hypothetical protein